MNLKPFGRWQPQPNQRSFGHAHFWERAMMSRRQFLKAGVATAVVFGSGLWQPKLVSAASLPGNAPKPIPGGTTIPGLGFFHFFFPTGGPPGALTIESGQGDPALITDFKGMVGVGDFSGGTGTGKTGVHTSQLFWKADVRFMVGEFIGVDGHHHHGAFAFV
jgi:hypothetical protein